MAAQIVMDYTGDTRHYFNTDNTEALSKAEAKVQDANFGRLYGCRSRRSGQSHRHPNVRPNCRRDAILPTTCWRLTTAFMFIHRLISAPLNRWRLWADGRRRVRFMRERREVIENIRKARGI